MKAVFFVTTCILLCANFQSCSPSNTNGGDSSSAATTEAPAPATNLKEQEKESPAIDSVAVPPAEIEAVEEEKVASEVSSLESNLQFIRDKYIIISNATNYKTASYKFECDGGVSEFERKTNEEEEVAYLKTVSCGQHGCRTTQHYFWDNELIFIFVKDSYFAGRNDFIDERRTYFKNGEMIQCLEKGVQSAGLQVDMNELVAKEPNKNVDCKPQKLTEDLQKMKGFTTEAMARSFFCEG